jgi:hypothetical protein
VQHFELVGLCCNQELEVFAGRHLVEQLATAEAAVWHSGGKAAPSDSPEAEWPAGATALRLSRFGRQEGLRADQDRSKLDLAEQATLTSGGSR